jgi:hypothetical protein
MPRLSSLSITTEYRVDRGRIVKDNENVINGLQSGGLAVCLVIRISYESDRNQNQERFLIVGKSGEYIIYMSVKLAAGTCSIGGNVWPYRNKMLQHLWYGTSSGMSFWKCYLLQICDQFV